VDGSKDQTRRPSDMADEWEMPWQKLSKIMTPGKFSKKDIEQAAIKAGEVVDLTCEDDEGGKRNQGEPSEGKDEAGKANVASEEENRRMAEETGAWQEAKGKDVEETVLGNRKTVEAGKVDVEQPRPLSLDVPSTYMTPPAQQMAGTVHPMMPVNPTFQLMGASFGRPDLQVGPHAYLSNWRPQPKKRRKLKNAEIDKKIVEYGCGLLFKTVKSFENQETSTVEEEETPKTHQFF